MKVLLAVSSRHGATAEIGKAIGEELAAQGVELLVHPIGTTEPPGDFDAAVLGSSVYAGHWERDLKDFVEQYGSSMTDKPVWLFSSGPIGDPPKPEEVPVDVDRIIEITKAHEHVVFAGKLDKSKLSFGEKAIVMAFRAPEGDFRDWDQIRSWAKGIAGALS